MITFKEHAQLNEFGPVFGWRAIIKAGQWVASNYPTTTGIAVGTATTVGAVGKVAVTKPVATTTGVYGVAYFADMEAVMATTEQTIAFVVAFALEHGLEITKEIVKGIFANLSGADQLKLGVVLFTILYLRYGKKIKSIWTKFSVIVKKLALKVKLGNKKLKQLKINKALGKKLGKMTT